MDRPLQSNRENELWLAGRWAEIQVGHGLWIRRDDDGRIVLPRDIVKRVGMLDRQKARILYIESVDDLKAASGERTLKLISKGAKAVLLLFSEKEEAV